AGTAREEELIQESSAAALTLLEAPWTAAPCFRRAALSKRQEAELPLSAAAARSPEVALVKERQALLHFLTAGFRSSKAAFAEKEAQLPPSAARARPGEAAFEEQTKALLPAFEAQAALTAGRRGKTPLFRAEPRSRKNAPEVKASARVQAAPADSMALA
ncbi:MAG: hypothetical protein WBS14_15130, partial [Rhodomicrobium sp.]